MKRIGFYGHSAACWANFPIYDQTSFIDMTIEKTGYKLVNKGVPQGSQERILFELKKTKKLDFAIIFHSIPKFVFLPTADRDVDINDIDQRKCTYMWKEKQERNELESMRDDYFNYGGIKEAFGDIKNFITTFASYREYLHHPDLQMNRFFGALVQIDQYVTHMKIPTIHIYGTKHIPNWFEFNKTSLQRPDIHELCEQHYQGGYPNNISAEGQHIIAEELINQLYILDEDHHLD
jgi:hypothetical protein